jgi:hypothetical protein
MIEWWKERNRKWDIKRDAVQNFHKAKRYKTWDKYVETDTWRFG